MASYIDINKYTAFNEFSSTFNTLLASYVHNRNNNIIFLCIGSDRSTGDCLGPLIGHKLSIMKYENVFVYGTLDSPVHAKNLSETIDKIKATHINPIIIAIDACLGSIDHIGYVSIMEGPLSPGTGVNKELPKVGDISIIGIVNMSGFMEFVILQNTRLNLVMKMADIISMGIKYSLSKMNSSIINNTSLYELNKDNFVLEQ